MRTIGVNTPNIGAYPESTLLANILKGKAYNIESNSHKVHNPIPSLGVFYLENRSSIALSVYIDRLFFSVGNVKKNPSPNIDDFFNFNILHNPDAQSPFILEGATLAIRNLHLGYPSTSAIKAIGQTTGKKLTFIGGSPVWTQELSTNFPLFTYPFIIDLMIASSNSMAITITLPNNIKEATINIAAQVYTMPVIPNMS